MSSYQGRLELTWTNKPLRLLAHDDGRYEWVSPADYRVAEVRLLDDVMTVGRVGRERAQDNLLIRGDALNALRSLGRLPEFAREYLGKVKLVYLDPPFNTQQSFLHYDDALEHSVWLTMIRDRLVQIRDLLAPKGRCGCTSTIRKCTGPAKLGELTGLSRPYCAAILLGERVPHPRWWEALWTQGLPELPGPIKAGTSG